jgi:hypothetical protein
MARSTPAQKPRGPASSTVNPPAAGLVPGVAIT